MDGLVKSEFRKIFSTKLWWALLIPAAVVTFGAAWAGSSLGAMDSVKQSAGISMPLGLLSVARGTNLAAVFAAVFGTLAMAGEYRNKTITTTYLTGVPRGAVLTAKLVTYLCMGLLYGVVNVAVASLGGLVGAGVADFPDIGSWLSLGAIGVVSMVLWMLLGVGVGTLLTNPVGSVVGIVLYTVLIENVVSSALAMGKITSVQAYLPNTAGSGMVSGLAADLFVEPMEQMQPGAAQILLPTIREFAGAGYALNWWLSMIIFAGYALVFCLAGWLVSRQRDIS